MKATILLALGILLFIVDWAQTLRIARDPERFYEAWNLVLPKHPSVAQVHTWFAAVALLVGLAFWFAPDARLLIACALFVIEGLCVLNNDRKGIKP